MGGLVDVRFYFFFFNDPATPEIYTLPLPDALPIPRQARPPRADDRPAGARLPRRDGVLRAGRRPGRARVRRPLVRDRKSTRLNSSHANISYAVFCLKKKQKKVYVKIQMGEATL